MYTLPNDPRSSTFDYESRLERSTCWSNDAAFALATFTFFMKSHNLSQA